MVPGPRATNLTPALIGANTEQSSELSTLRSQAGQEQSCTRGVASGEQPCPPGAGSLSPPPIRPRILWWRNPFSHLPQAPTHPSPVLLSGIFYPTTVCPTKPYSPLQSTGLSPPCTLLAAVVSPSLDFLPAPLS